MEASLPGTASMGLAVPVVGRLGRLMPLVQILQRGWISCLSDPPQPGGASTPRRDTGLMTRGSTGSTPRSGRRNHEPVLRVTATIDLANQQDETLYAAFGD